VFKRFSGSTETVFMFKCSTFSVMEAGGSAKVVVLRGTGLHSFTFQLNLSRV